MREILDSTFYILTISILCSILSATVSAITVDNIWISKFREDRLYCYELKSEKSDIKYKRCFDLVERPLEKIQK